MYGYYRYWYNSIGVLFALILISIYYIYNFFQWVYINYTFSFKISVLVILTSIIYLIIDNYIKKFEKSNALSQKTSSHIGEQVANIQNDVYLEPRCGNFQSNPNLYECPNMQNLGRIPKGTITSSGQSAPLFVEKNINLSPETKKGTFEKTSNVPISTIGSNSRNVLGNFYETQYWKSLASGIRARDKYICQKCGKHGPRDGVILDVHHIKPRRMFGPSVSNDVMDAPENLITLCRKCHEAQPHHERLRNT